MRAPRPDLLAVRTAGVLLHPSSLPAPHGIGDIGASGRAFLSFLECARQRVWQMLPLHPAGYGNSPYQGLSAFAGNPLLLSIADLVPEGWLRPDEIESPRLPPGRVPFARAWKLKEPLLRRAFERFRPDARFEAFCSREERWLENWCLFAALKRSFQDRAWLEWDEPLRLRLPTALDQARVTLASEIAFERFLQFVFELQWSALRASAVEHRVALVGDIPLYLAHDSAEVWSGRERFQLDEAGHSTAVAGVPPDYFSATGQLWGNPLYRWDVLEREDFLFWRERLGKNFERFDTVRFDHFIGLTRAWEIPAHARTAFEGHYEPVPGERLLQRLSRDGPLPLIAEDLGVVIPEVKRLRDAFGLPGMRILQFAFGDDPEAESYKPHNFPRRCVAYTGTHDNDTAVGWYEDRGGAASTRRPEAIAEEKAYLLRYLGSDGRQIARALIRLAMGSIADLAIAPLQDWLQLPTSARMNRPGTLGGNWEWRAAPDALSPPLAEIMGEMAEDFGRA